MASCQTTSWRCSHDTASVPGHTGRVDVCCRYGYLTYRQREHRGTPIIFGKAPHRITNTEALILAVLLRAPNAHPMTVARRAVALQQNQGQPVISEYLIASVQRALTSHSTSHSRPSLAPHVAQRLLRYTSGTNTVRSTLDGRLQELATDSLRRHLMAMQTQHAYDGAVLVVENVSGEVLAYVGGSGKLSSARHGDGIQGRRQTGSILKPFIYGMALER
jgi:penicillin-binding protein 1C